MDKKNLPLIMGVVVFALVIRNIQLMREVSKLKEEVAQLKIQPKQMSCLHYEDYVYLSKILGEKPKEKENNVSKGISDTKN